MCSSQFSTGTLCVTGRCHQKETLGCAKLWQPDTELRVSPFGENLFHKAFISEIGLLTYFPLHVGTLLAERPCTVIITLCSANRTCDSNGRKKSKEEMFLSILSGYLVHLTALCIIRFLISCLQSAPHCVSFIAEFRSVKHFIKLRKKAWVFF